ncbi:MAG: gamma-glutamylcyclotransferase [Lautropia sp.]|nr:gamma-glutamylcyclotransferase [Lautropia sp.]
MKAPAHTLLTRELLQSDAFLQSFANTPGFTAWTQAQISQSLDDMLSRRPKPQAPVWLFAYGSLIWNPLFLYVERQRASLRGWHRSFSMKLTAGRGTPERPGRMLALTPSFNPDTCTEGLAFRLDETQLRDELMLVWRREMVGGTYCPRWERVTLADGRRVDTLIFVMNHEHPVYEADASVATVAPLIVHATGHLGHNLDYLLDLEKALAEHDIHDPYIDDLVAAVRAYAAYI